MKLTLLLPVTLQEPVVTPLLRMEIPYACVHAFSLTCMSTGETRLVEYVAEDLCRNYMMSSSGACN